MANERWDGEETGSGVSDGRAFAPPLRAVLDEIERPKGTGHLVRLRVAAA